jgi:hypothetical protein
MPAKKIWINVTTTDKPCSQRNRFLSAMSVAWFIAGINNCLAATAVSMTKAINAELNGSDVQDSAMTKPDKTITKR